LEKHNPAARDWSGERIAENAAKPFNEYWEEDYQTWRREREIAVLEHRRDPRAKDLRKAYEKERKARYEALMAKAQIAKAIAH
jgi:hypothetical protein